MTSENSNPPSQHSSKSETEQNHEGVGKEETEEQESRSGVQGAGTG